LSDIQSLVSVAEKLKTDIDNTDIGSMINDALSFYQGGKQAITDCTSIAKRSLKSGFDPIACI